jgi:integrase/recombinase XerD
LFEHENGRAKLRAVALGTSSTVLRAVVHALARFIAEHCPEHIEWVRHIRNHSFKRAMKREITYMEQSEMEALLAAPDRRTRQG